MTKLDDIVGLVNALQTLKPDERERLFKLATKTDVYNASMI
jgi:hypothetical protein